MNVFRQVKNRQNNTSNFVYILNYCCLTQNSFSLKISKEIRQIIVCKKLLEKTTVPAGATTQEAGARPRTGPSAKDEESRPHPGWPHPALEASCQNLY